jgi:hypothetical protein
MLERGKKSKTYQLSGVIDLASIKKLRAKFLFTVYLKTANPKRHIVLSVYQNDNNDTLCHVPPLHHMK